MAKRIRVSDDDGSSWYTLPGNTAESTDEAGEIDDTIFGQDFASTQTGLIGWTINANGLYKGFAGYVATLKKIGTSTNITDESTSQVGSTKTWQITDAAKRALNRAVAVVVKDGDGTVSATNIVSIDYLFGRVTFASGFTPNGGVTISGAYFPLSNIGCANEYTLSQTANSNDNTCMDTAQGNQGHRTFEYGLKTVSLELNGIYKAANGFRQLLKDRTELIIEINPDGNNKAVARGFFKPVSTGQSGDVGDLEEETITFNLSVPDVDVLEVPFKWVITSDALLNVAIQKCIFAWEDKDIIKVAYLPDGLTGYMGDAIVTDLTLTGGLEVMNEFTINFQGTDETEPYA